MLRQNNKNTSSLCVGIQNNGEILYNLIKYQETIEFYNKAIKIDYNFEDASNKKGVI